MALTRKSLKAMGLTDEQADSIIEMHTETMSALKEQRDAYKADAEKLAEVQAELEAMKNDGYKSKYESEHSAFEAYIIYNLCRLELIEGVVFAEIDNLPYQHPINLDDCMITPTGIEYLTDNATWENTY